MGFFGTRQWGQAVRVCCLGVGLLIIPLLAGCGSEPVTVSARGKVSYEGQPLPQGAVLFNPTDATMPPVLGRIRSDGTYEIQAAPGEYKVVVTAVTGSDPGVEYGDPAYKPPQSLIPEKLRTEGAARFVQHLSGLRPRG